MLALWRLPGSRPSPLTALLPVCRSTHSTCGGWSAWARFAMRCSPDRWIRNGLVRSGEMRHEAVRRRSPLLAWPPSSCWPRCPSRCFSLSGRSAWLSAPPSQHSTGRQIGSPPDTPPVARFGPVFSWWKLRSRSHNRQRRFSHRPRPLGPLRFRPSKSDPQVVAKPCQRPFLQSEWRSPTSEGWRYQNED